MRTDFKIAATVCGILLTLFIAALMVSSGPQPAKASTDFGNYNSTRITAANASSTSGTRLLYQQGTLGSVVLIGASAASSTATTELRVYDASSATSTGRLIASFATTTSAGVWTFDVQVNSGLVIDVPTGFTGQAVVTYR